MMLSQRFRGSKTVWDSSSRAQKGSGHNCMKNTGVCPLRRAQGGLYIHIKKQLKSALCNGEGVSENKCTIENP